MDGCTRPVAAPRVPAGPDAYTGASGTPRDPCAVSPRSPEKPGVTTTVAVKIRLKRMGKIRAPFYRVVVMDSRTKRDGRAIEEIGKYHPTEEPSLIQIDSERAQYWLGNGAQPTEAVAALLKITGDWQKYKGEPGTEGTLKVKAPKTPKKDLYEAALAAAGKSTDDSTGATTPRKRAAKKAEETPVEAPAAEAPADEAPAAEASVAEAPVAEAPVAEAEAPAAEATDGEKA
jgi:small subunit ribosomal protein S16